MRPNWVMEIMRGVKSWYIVCWLCVFFGRLRALEEKFAPPMDGLDLVEPTSGLGVVRMVGGE